MRGPLHTTKSAEGLAIWADDPLTKKLMAVGLVPCPESLSIGANGL